MTDTEKLGLRERHKRDTRVALHDAALELAVERGLGEVTRADIAARAGVSLRTLQNYFANKYEALAYRHIQQARRSVAALQQRPSNEPLWTSITEAVLHPLEEAGVAQVLPTREQIAKVRTVIESPEARLAVSNSVFANAVTAIADRTGTDPHTDMYPRLVVAVVRAVVETAMEVFVRADPPVHITTVLRRGLAATAAGLPAPPQAGR